MKEPEVKTPALTNSKKKRAKVPAHVYLLPSERKFPYKRWRNGEWVVSCADLRDAIRLAAVHGYRKVLKKAPGDLREGVQEVVANGASVPW